MLDVKRVLGALPKKRPAEAPRRLTTPWGSDVAAAAAEALEAGDAAAAEKRFIPRGEHPRPQFARLRWTCLNGWWTCTFSPLAYNAEADATKACALAKPPAAEAFANPILVPFSPEAPLSGVNRRTEPGEALWYRRTFVVPPYDAAAGERLLLHFEGVDDSCAVWVDDVFAGCHEGAYTPFTCDLTAPLAEAGRAPGEVCTLTVCVVDPSDAGVQLRGKQVLRPGNIWYTAQSGLLQPVWLEAVPASHIKNVAFTCDNASGELTVEASVSGPGVLAAKVLADGLPVAQGAAAAEVREAEPELAGADDAGGADGASVAGGSGGADNAGGAPSPEATARVTLHVRNPHLWSPDDPFLYDVELLFSNDAANAAANEAAAAAAAMAHTHAHIHDHAHPHDHHREDGDFGGGLGATDVVRSYAAFREVRVQPDAAGTPRVHLNGSPIFLRGVLNQGYWPDGLMTAPADDAFAHDILAMRRAGFNMLRTHIKVEAERFYYLCDTLGMLVWQDMPSGGSAAKALRTQVMPTLFTRSWSRYSDTVPTHWISLGAASPRYRALWRSTAAEVVANLRNHPSIITWVLFNEGWGQFASASACEMVRAADGSRPVQAVSGWYDQGAGDFFGVHNYFRPQQVFADPFAGKAAREPREGDPTSRATGTRTARACVTDEFGGLVLNVPGHAQLSTSFGYDLYEDRETYAAAVRALLAQMDALEAKGLAGYVYTQVSDVEEETNGILTYDRRVNKLTASGSDSDE